MDAMLSGDANLARRAFSDNAVWYDTFVGTVRGNEAIGAVFGALKGEAFDTSTIEVRSSLASGDTGAIEWVQVLHTGGRSLTIEGTSWVTVVDGQIGRLWDYVQPIKGRKL